MQTICKRSYVVLRLVCCLVFISALTTVVNAQTVSLSGSVRDRETGEAIVGASIKILGTRFGALSNLEGKYRIENLPVGDYKVQCSAMSYESQTVAVRVMENQELNFRLSLLNVNKGEITVTSEREKDVLRQATQSIARMEKADLDKHRGQTLGETLRELPGVTVLQTGPSIAKPVVRGLHSQRVVVLNAGVRQEGQQWGAEHAPEIDPFAAAKIEVIKGAASVEYGADAIGGVIRVEPRPLPKNHALSGELTLNAFGNNAQGALSALLESAIGEAWGWRAQVSYRRAGDAATPQYFLTNTGFTELNASAMAGIAGDWGEVTAYYSRFATELGVLKSAHIGNVTDLVRSMQRTQPIITEPFSFRIDFPRQRITHDLLSLRAKLELGSLGNLQLNYGYQQNIRQEFDAHVPLGTDPSRREIPAFDLTLYTHTAEAKLNHYPIANFIGALGVAALVQSNKNFGLTGLIPNFSAVTGGIFWREEWVKDDWTVHAGVRYDLRWQRASPYGSSRIARQLASGVIQDQQNFQTVTGAIGVIYQFAPEWSIGAQAATAWRAPSINELYSDGVHHGTAQYETGDPNLQIERSFNLDATLRHIGARTRLELSIYRNAISNFIYLFPTVEPVITIRGAFPGFEYRQANALLYGIDGFFEWEVSEIVRAFASLSAVRAWNEAQREPLINMPSDRAIIGCHVDLPSILSLEKTYLEISTTLVRVQDQYPRLEVPNSLPPAVSDEEAYRFYVENLTRPPAGYGLLNLSLGTELKIFNQETAIRLTAQNVLDQRYRDYLSRFRFFADDAGRNIILRLSMNFGAISGK